MKVNMKSTSPCKINKERVLNSYHEEIKRMGEDSDRSRLQISKEKILRQNAQELWKLWVLANLYQRTSEKASQARFMELMGDLGDQIIFSPERINSSACVGTCPLLDSNLSINKCDYNNRYDACKYPAHRNGCIMMILSHKLARHPSYRRIASTLVSSAVFLQAYEYDLHRMYMEMEKGGKADELLEVLKTLSGLKHGQKIPSMFLAWLSNPAIYGIWKLDYSQYIPVDVNVRRVARRAVGCANDQQIKEAIQKFSNQFDLNVRIVELSFLNVGQVYCHKNAPNCLLCLFGYNDGTTVFRGRFQNSRE